jgi:hypothetical protein
MKAAGFRTPVLKDSSKMAPSCAGIFRSSRRMKQTFPMMVKRGSVAVKFYRQKKGDQTKVPQLPHIDTFFTRLTLHLTIPTGEHDRIYSHEYDQCIAK